MNAISEPVGMELIQGQSIIQPAHYERQEQILCAVDGFS